MVDQILQKRIAVVTGADSGIGASCVAALAAAGADVALLVIKFKDGEAGASTVEALGQKAVIAEVDVSDEKSVERAFDVCARGLGVPDVLVNSAGRNMSGVKVADMSLRQWSHLIAVDLTGSFLTSRRFVRDLLPTGRQGSIINITSIHSSVMRPGGADYDAAKGGQRNLTKTLALETARAGITVNAIAPGMILTPMNERALDDPDYRRKLENDIPVGRAGRPDEVAQVAVFLASPAAAYITGSTVTIDGGLSLELGQGA
jgi:glucose 1-dehydrogenase